MNVLIACEFSGIIQNAFREKRHHAVSIDLLPTEKSSNHIEGDVRDYLLCNWDMMIAHPPCTHLAVSGARWFKDKQQEQKEAIAFFMELVNAPFPKVCVENPISIMSTLYRKPDQIIQPWWFGHGETKSTCLWLKGLPKLEPTEFVEGRNPRVHYESPGPNRWKNRSRTLPGIANAMATQWNF